MGCPPVGILAMTKVNANDAVIADPVQRLAAQVITSAIADAGAGDETAQVFLDNSPPLRWWCEVAGVDAGVIVSRFWRARPNEPSAHNART